MEKLSNLFWAIVWGVVFVLAVFGIFWNWAHIFTAFISFLFCAAFVGDYIKAKKL